jgi:hypothetical protein
LFGVGWDHAIEKPATTTRHPDPQPGRFLPYVALEFTALAMLEGWKERAGFMDAVAGKK